MTLRMKKISLKMIHVATELYILTRLDLFRILILKAALWIAQKKKLAFLLCTTLSRKVVDFF
jgi:hypothetical protein